MQNHKTQQSYVSSYMTEFHWLSVQQQCMTNFCKLENVSEYISMPLHTVIKACRNLLHLSCVKIHSITSSGKSKDDGIYIFINKLKWIFFLVWSLQFLYWRHTSLGHSQKSYMFLLVQSLYQIYAQFVLILFFFLYFCFTFSCVCSLFRWMIFIPTK
jgi:hypothetical protein